jgi:hypothetical protein
MLEIDFANSLVESVIVRSLISRVLGLASIDQLPLMRFVRSAHRTPCSKPREREARSLAS